MIKFFLLVFSLYYFSVSTFGAIQKPVGGVDWKTMKGELKTKKLKLDEMTSELHGLEKNLGKNNKKYLRVVKKRKKIEGQIFLLRKSVLAQAIKTKEEIKKTKKVMSKIVLNELFNEQRPEDLLTSKITKKVLKNKLKELHLGFEQIKLLQNKMKILEIRFNEYTELEDQLISLINLMESQKSIKAQNYLNQRKDFYKSYTKLETQKRKKSKNKRVRKQNLRKKFGSFGSPLESYEKIDYKKKGITYTFSRKQPVKATRDGFIVHKGALSTFGNVIMIDHGEDTRTILLGSFNPKVKIGLKIKKGDVLGYTEGSRGSTSKLYFEVRKKNKVLQTINLLDEQLLAKNMN